MPEIIYDDVFAPNITIRGAWNVAIFDEVWLSREICSNAQVQTEIKPVLPIMEVRFRLPDGVLVSPTPDKLFIRADKTAKYENVMNTALLIIKKLPHTPVMAIGNNISFALKKGTDFLEKNGVAFSCLAEKISTLAESSHLKGLKANMSFQCESYILNLTYAKDNGVEKIFFNFHYHLQKNTQAGRQTEIKKIINKFDFCCKDATLILESLIRKA